MQHLVKALFQAVFLFRDGDQQIRADRRPDLAADGILGTTVKIPDAQVLFDPFEEQFDLPAPSVKIANHLGLQLEVIGQEYQGAFALRVAEVNPSQRLPAGAA